MEDVELFKYVVTYVEGDHKAAVIMTTENEEQAAEIFLQKWPDRVILSVD